MIPHVEFQFLTSQYRTSFGLLHPEVKKTLEVSDVQSERMQALVRKFEQDSKQLMAKLQTQRKTAEKNFHSSVVKLLDERQKEKLSDWTPSR